MGLEIKREKGTAAWAVVGLFLLVAVFALREARALLAPVFIAVVLTLVLAPCVRWLRRHGIPEVLGALLLVFGLLASTVPLVASLARPAETWWQSAPAGVAQLMAQLDKLRASIPGLYFPPRAAPPSTDRPVTPVSKTHAEPPTPAVEASDPLKEKIASEGLALTGAVLGHGMSFLVSASAMLILLYFLLASEHWMLSRLVEAVPRRRARALLLGGVRGAQREIGRYLFALGCINSLVGLLTTLAVWSLSLPNPLLWGVVAAVLGFVPYIGPLVVMGLLVLAGVTTFSTWPAMLGPAFAYLVIRATEANIVSPWIVGRRLSLSPISVVLSVMFWGWLWGIAGALIAVPLLIALRNVTARTRKLRLIRRLLEGDRRQTPSLRSLVRLPPHTTWGRRPRPTRLATPATAANESIVTHWPGGPENKHRESR